MQRALEEVLQRIRHPERDRDALHALFSYPAKFQATVPTLILQYFSSAGDLVLDPYGGGGTTAACCRMTGRNSVHLDLNPLSCLVALAKTTRLRHADVELAILLLARAKKPARPSLLTAEETVLFGPSVSEAAEIAFAAILRAKAEKNPVAPVLACLLIKCLKLCGRRDAVARRGKPASEHLGWIQRELRTLHTKTEGIYPFEVRHRIRCGSNHETGLGRASVSLIITSPPYPGVDIEYNEIQIQRRDLKRCFRSDVGVRIANAFYPGEPRKRDLCDGGAGDYFENARTSLTEMRRVLRDGGFAFLYCGFKHTADRERYERILKETGFKLLARGEVTLSDDRVASSRSTHHGRTTRMMKRDFLYILR